MDYWTKWKNKRLRDYLGMSDIDLTMYENKTTITHTSIPIYRVYTFDPVLLRVDTDSLHCCIGERALERTARLSGRRSNLIIDSKLDSKFGVTLVGSSGEVELMLLASGSTFDTQSYLIS